MDIKQLITFRTLAQEKNYMKTSEKIELCALNPGQAHSFVRG